MLPLAQMVALCKGLLRLPIRVRRRDYCEVELERAKVDMLKSKAAPEGPFASNALVAGARSYGYFRPALAWPDAIGRAKGVSH